MPTARVNGVDLYYEDTGGSKPVVVFSHGLLWSTRMWDAQVRHLSDRFRCIAWDHRGQGRSEKPRVNAIGMDTVADDAAAFLGQLGVGPVRFCGLSMGGFVGMRVAARRPELIEKLVLIETAADKEPSANKPKYGAMNAVARLGGMKLLSNAIAPIMFGDSFLEDASRTKQVNRARAELTGNARSIHRAVRGVVERADFIELDRITAPTLVIHSREDRAIAEPRARALHAGIAGAKWVQLPRGGHSVTVEEPALVNAELDAFL